MISTFSGNSCHLFQQLVFPAFSSQWYDKQDVIHGDVASQSREGKACLLLIYEWHFFGVISYLCTQRTRETFQGCQLSTMLPTNGLICVAVAWSALVSCGHLIKWGRLRLSVSLLKFTSLAPAVLLISPHLAAHAFPHASLILCSFLPLTHLIITLSYHSSCLHVASKLSIINLSLHPVSHWGSTVDPQSHTFNSFEVGYSLHVHLPTIKPKVQIFLLL